MDIYTILNDLIVLGIIGIILTLFRKYDKNSKSLEQVKKYASKRNEEFDLYVEEKIVFLKDLSLQLDVQEKTGKVILNRINDDVDDLSVKIEHIDELNKKVISYNSTMDKMLDLTKDLDERYNKLKKDSLFIESLDKKLKDGSKKLFAVEKNIEEITGEFIKNNNISMSKLKDEMFHSIEEKTSLLDSSVKSSNLEVDRLNNIILNLKNEYNSSSNQVFDKFKNEINALVETHRSHIDQITKDGEAVEESNFKDLKNRIEARSQSLLSILEEKLKLIEVENNEKISKLSMDMGNVEQIATKIQEENNLRLDSIKEQLSNQLVIIKDLNSKGILELQTEFKNDLNQFRDESIKSISESRENAIVLVNDINSKILEAENYKNEVVNSFASTESYINSELSDLKIRFDESINNVAEELESHEEKVKDAAFRRIEENIDSYKKEVERKINEFSIGKETLTTDIDKLQLEINNLAVSNRELFKSEKDSFMHSFNELKDNYNLLTMDLNNSNIEIRNQISENKIAIIESVKKDLISQINSIKSEIETILTETNNKFKEDLDTEHNNLKEFINNFNNDKKTLEAEIHRIKEVSYTNIKDKLNIFEDEYFSKLKEKEEFINSETEKWKKSIDHSVNSIKDESIATIIQNMENFNLEINSFKDGINFEFIQFKNENENRLSNFMVKLQEEERVLAENKDLFNANIERDIRSIESSIKSLNDDLSRKDEDLRNSLSLIEEEQHKFIETTNIFNRTDLLQSDLTNALILLEGRIEEVNTKVGYIGSTNDKLDMLKTLIDNINNQISLVEDKKVKIDSLELRVNKVIELSNTIDDKLNSIKNSENEISNIQLRLRELKELESAVSLEFKRLEDKNDILTETNRAIDSGFGQIQNIENRIDLFKESLTPVNNQIENIQNKISKVENRGVSIDKAIKTLSNLENYISDMESKIEKMDKAREWIAGVETRLNESVRTADEQVKLMGALVQNRNDKNIDGKSSPAPNTNMREMVTKLAHNGWKAEDIARTTKLSRGEVELILELSPRE